MIGGDPLFSLEDIKITEQIMVSFVADTQRKLGYSWLKTESEEETVAVKTQEECAH